MDKITPKTIRGGSVLQVNPGERSHTNIPYNVLVVESNDVYFSTKLIDPDMVICKKPHIRTFVYNSQVWRDYHESRFNIIMY